jgi:hypothetical protein
MALGKRKRQHQLAFWVPADKLGGGPRNAFYDRLNQLLGEIDFNGKLEKAAALGVRIMAGEEFELLLKEHT